MPAKLIECDKVNQEPRDILDRLIDEYREDIARHGVKIGLLFAVSSKIGEHPLKHRGKRAAGTCKVNSYKDRVEGKPDATITLDGNRWHDWSETRKVALIHHELAHIDFCEGKRDALGRPILKGRYGDWEFDGFDDVLRLYGRDSFEYANLHAVAEEHRQLSLPFAEAPTIEAQAAPVAVDAPALAIAETPAEDESWRAVRLGTLDLTPKILQSLAEVKLETVGDVADFTSNGVPLTQIKGIGEAAAGKIDEALASFWAGRKAPTEAVREAAPAVTIAGGGGEGASVKAEPAPSTLWRDIKISAVVHGKKGADEIVATLLADEYPIANLGDLADALNPERTNFDNVLMGCGLGSEQIDVLAEGLSRLRREHGGEIRRLFTAEVLGLAEPAEPEPSKPRTKPKKAAAAQASA